MSTDLRIRGMFERGPAVTIMVDGKAVPAYGGESVAAALLSAGQLRLRTSPGGGARGALCHMGVCQECTVEHEGRAVSSCQLAAVDGMTIRLRDFSDKDH